MLEFLKKGFLHMNGVVNMFISELRKSQRRKYKNQHQLTSTTKPNRYPEIFTGVANLVSKNNLKILSFGCSTGEECVSLQQYFPEGQIIGADINMNNLKIASRTNSSQQIKFILSTSEHLISNGPYDIIFALSVLCRWDDTKDLDNCSSIYPFTKYQETVGQLFELLNNGGLLVIYNANFMIEDTNYSKQLIPCHLSSVTNSGFVHKFDRNNNRFYQPHNVVIYKKNEDFT